MASVVRPYGGRNDPLQPLAQVSHVAPQAAFKGGKAGGVRYPEDDGLAITYELHDQQPYYHPDTQTQSVKWAQNDAPVARNKPGHGVLPAFDLRNDRSNRVDSVFDAYVDMYADDGDEEGHEVDDTVEQLQSSAPAPSSYRQSPSNDSGRQEDLVPYEAHAQSREPWDERGKTGLYGGGGRGADDRETGWVRDYAFSPIPPITGYEEDLRFGGDDGEEDVGPRSRINSRGTVGSRSRGDDDVRRESSDTAPSSKGPNTPPDSSTCPTSGLRYGQNYDGAPASPPQAVHTIDAARIKKKMGSPTIPTPSAPISVNTPIAPAVPPVPSGIGASSDRPRPRRKSTGFKWGGRSKKAPTISAPILPEGFVESLGMETFALYPGVKPPSHAILSPVMRNTSSPKPPRGFSSPEPQHQPAQPARAPPTRKAAPRPKNAPAPHSGGSPPRSQRLGSGSERSTSFGVHEPIRLPLGALRDDTDTASEGYPEDMFRRLSKNSDGSYVPASVQTTHRQFFNDMRQEHGRQEEVQANRGVIPMNVPGAPSARPSPSHNSAPATGSPFDSAPSHGRNDSTATAGSGFRDPWAAGNRSSMASQRTQQYGSGGQRGSLYLGSERASLASTAHEMDYRKGSQVSARSHHTPSPPQSYQQPQQQQQQQQRTASPGPLDRAPEDRNGSFSSAYSETSEAPPHNTFHPSNAFHPGFGPSNAVGQLRKNSLAGGLPIGFPSSSPAEGGHQRKNSYVPIQPLNLAARRPSYTYRAGGGGGANGTGTASGPHGTSGLNPASAAASSAANRDTTYGDVVWGGAGVGGPRDTSSPMPGDTGSSFAAPRAPTIGTTGFRNPFG
ncbi:uncharacterized protein JCM10292_000827 [Rhodotorula paludigena]|uniref:uncharacterized protein n=1 Tax=Rhodotorula paludigena TaxID=86838 RepID=UPI0031780B5A